MSRSKPDLAKEIPNACELPLIKPTEYVDNNVLGFYNIISAANKHKVKRIIYASSGSVYGIKSEKNVTEDLYLKPISLYNKPRLFKVLELFES